jgi:hypothetical protein
MSSTKSHISLQGSYACNIPALTLSSALSHLSHNNRQGSVGFMDFHQCEHRYSMLFICRCPQYGSHMLFIYQANQRSTTVSMSKYQPLCQSMSSNKRSQSDYKRTLLMLSLYFSHNLQICTCFSQQLADRSLVHD